MSAHTTISAASLLHVETKKVALNSYKARFFPILRSGTGEHDVREILELVREDLAAVKGVCRVELCSTPEHRRFLEIDAGSDQDAKCLLRDAVNFSEKYIDPTPKVMLLLELPCFNKNTRVNAKVGERPILTDAPDLADPQVTKFPEISDIGHHKISELTGSLIGIGRGPNAFSLRVDFGQYILRTFPSSKQDWACDEFKAKLFHNRCKGETETNMEDTSLLKPVLSFARQETGLRGLEPQHFFETRSEQCLFQATVVSLPTRPGFPPELILGHISACHQVSRQPARLTVSSIGLGKMFDWKLETTREQKVSTAAPAIVELLKRAIIKMNETDELGPTPDIKIDVAHPAASRLGRHVTIKTVYKIDYEYEKHAYVVEVSIYRQWNNIMAMSSSKPPPKVTWGIGMYQESWQGVHAGERSWGNNLQFLLARRGDTGHCKPEDRILELIRDIHSIRDKLTQVADAYPAGRG